MRILIIGDPHFKHNNEIETNMMCDKIYQIVLEQKPDIIVDLGDTLDTHSHIDMNPLNRATKFLFQLSQMSSHLYVLIGNHDRPNNTDFLTEASPFASCKIWPNTTIVDKVCIGEHNGLKFVFVPYVPVGRFNEALETQNITSENIKDYSIVFAHQEFKGSKMGAIVSTSGDEWPIEYPFCISGHVHGHQKIQDNLEYVGTPIQHAFGDATPKGVMMLSIDESRNISYEYFDLGLPKKMIVHLSAEQLSSYVLPENCFVKLVCSGDSKVIREITKLDSVKELLKNPRVKLSIKEDKSKVVVGGAVINVAPVKAETIPFQTRLKNTFHNQNDEIKTLFKSIFGEI
jgi:DNA repair exonuclease SbcCD nuclease subunit